jgi:hypothetical protein
VATKLAQLVGRVHRQRLDEAAGRDLLGGLLDPAHPAGQGLGHHVPAAQRHDQRGGRGQQKPVLDEGHGLVHVGEAARVQRQPVHTAVVGQRLGQLPEGLALERALAPGQMAGAHRLRHQPLVGGYASLLA